MTKQHEHVMRRFCVIVLRKLVAVPTVTGAGSCMNTTRVSTTVTSLPPVVVMAMQGFTSPTRITRSSRPSRLDAAPRCLSFHESIPAALFVFTIRDAEKLSEVAVQ